VPPSPCPCHSNPPGDSVATSVGSEALGAHSTPSVLGFLYRRDLYADVTFMLVVGPGSDVEVLVAPFQFARDRKR
jgi:hypothetical protein